jgi:hypothetical protein
MKIAVTGASGLVGSAVLPVLEDRGHSVFRLVRRAPFGERNEIPWSPDIGVATLADCDALVHLAGENIGERRWSEDQKQRIRDSRVQGTRALATSIARLAHKPATLVCASAVGFYGDRDDQPLREEDAAGQGYLAEVCQQWEAATEAARETGIRVVNLRFGVILSAAGGALAKMLLPFRLGLGGIVGNGRQYWSWISQKDAAASILHALEDQTLAGPVNAVSPTPCTNREFTKTLGQVLHRPTLLPLPAFAARLAFGEMAQGLLLASARVLPAKLEASGFRFQHRLLDEALRDCLP